MLFFEDYFVHNIVIQIKRRFLYFVGGLYCSRRDGRDWACNQFRLSCWLCLASFNTYKRHSDPRALTMATTKTPVDLVEEAKRAAAYRAVDDHFPENAKVVGIGSGSTVVYVVDRIAQRSDVANVIFVPTGFQSRELIKKAGLTVGNIDYYKVGDLDVAFDGADEIDEQLNCIKGGGGCLFQEKLVSQCARKFVMVADYRKKSTALGLQWTQGVPIEIVGMSYNKVIQDLKDMGASQVVLRQGGKAKAGPIVTDNNNLILDTVFPVIQPDEVAALDRKIKLLVGVVETGLFTHGDVAYFGEINGTFSVRTRTL